MTTSDQSPLGVAAPLVTEGDLARVVPAFYERVQLDPMLGPVFTGAIAEWDVHLEKLIAFWSSVMLTSGRYKGNPVAMHMKHVSEITPPMFNRWLALWADVTGELLPPASAVALQNKATRIAESLKLALYFRLAPTVGSPTGLDENASRKDC
ncbi:MAG: group III truncated hemoglobin [Croceibacterium sp.]